MLTGLTFPVMSLLKTGSLVLMSHFTNTSVIISETYNYARPPQRVNKKKNAHCSTREDIFFNDARLACATLPLYAYIEKKFVRTSFFF